MRVMAGIGTGTGPGGHWKVLLIVLICTLWNHTGQCEDPATGSSAPTSSPGESSASPSSPGESSASPSSPGESSASPSSPGESSTSPSSPGDNSTSLLSPGESSTSTSSPGESSTSPSSPSSFPDNSSHVHTQLSTSTVPSTTPTVRSKTTIPSEYKKDISDMTVPVSLKIKFDNQNFSKELDDRESSLYRNKSSEYQQKLETALNGTKGFVSVKIRGFWPGSLGVDFTLKYNYTFVRDNLTEELLRDQLKHLDGVNETFLNETLAEGLDAAKKQLEEDPCILVCPLWNCHKDSAGTVECVSPCLNHDCGGKHDCIVNSEKQPKCLCKSDEKYVYEGEFCKKKTEKLKLSSTTIIAIACGIGGGLIFILSLALLVTCCRKRKHGGGKMRGFDDQKSDVSFQSMTGMQPLSMGMTQDSSRLYRQETGEDFLVASFSRRETGLPADPMDRSVHRTEATRMEEAPPKGRVHYGEDGRLYRVIKDSHLYKDPGEAMAFRNEAFDAFPEETSLSDLGVTKAAFQRRSHGSAKENVYSELSDGTSQTFMYQPSDVIPRSNFTSLTHINPVAATDPDDLSGFSRRDDVRRQDDVKRVSDDRSRSGSTAAYSDRWMQDSLRHDEHPGAPVKVFPDREVKAYPTKEPDYPGSKPLYPGSRDPGYQTREPPYPAKSAHAGREYDSPTREPPYPAKYVYSGRKTDYPAREPPYPAREPAYPAREPAYPAREPAYPAREPASLSMESSYRGSEKEGVTYSKFGKAVLPGEAHEAHNPLIHDFSDKGQGRHQQQGSEMRGPADRARVYDYVPEAGKLSILRPVFSNKPMY